MPKPVILTEPMFRRTRPARTSRTTWGWRWQPLDTRSSRRSGSRGSTSIWASKIRRTPAATSWALSVTARLTTAHAQPGTGIAYESRFFGIVGGRFIEFGVLTGSGGDLRSCDEPLQRSTQREQHRLRYLDPRPPI